MKERLRASDYRFIAVCLVLFAGATWYSVRNFYRAFPEASIDFRVNRAGAQALAGGFLAGQGYRVEDYRQASRFSFDDQAKTFLEREAGLEQANRIMGTRVRLWRWAYRWFRPQQKEEYGVEITPRGELAGFRHEIPEEAARPAASAGQARALAEDFLRTRMHRDPASLEFVEESDQTRPHRVDRELTWKERDFNLRDATIRLTVTVLGNEVGGYREYLKIPEQWTRDYQRLRSRNEVTQIIDTAVMVALILGLVVVIVMRVRRQDVRWRRAAVVGLVGMALSLCASLNQFPLNEFGYPTTDSYGSFLSQQLLQAMLSALGSGGLLFVLIAGAETLYREALPNQISLGNLFRPRGLRTKRFFLGVILGVTLAGIFIAYQTAFYIVAYRFGAWSPAEVPYDNLLNTRFPWLFVLFFGFFPAVSEEGLFRMFAIPLLHKLVRYLPVAVVLAAFIWGFGHAGYPQQPFYIRGLEVGIGGVALGLIMLRWGILPTLVWHYSVDAGYTALLLVRSHNLYFQLSGAASAGIVVLPLAAALVAYWWRGGFEPESGLLNAEESAAHREPAEAAPAGCPPGPAATAEHRPLTARVRLAAIAIFAAGLLSLLIPVSRFGDSPKYQIPAGRARAAADAFLNEQGLDSGGFRHLTYPEAHWSGGDSLAGKYFLERRPVSFASHLFERYRPVQHWMTRYFKSLDQEEYTVSVHPETGKVLGFAHTIPEDRTGADIPEDRARQIASAFAAAQGWDLAAMDLKESTSEKKKARRDYTLEWEARAGDPRNLDEAHYRAHLEVAGDRVSSLRSYWKIPEAYERGRERQNALAIALLALRIGAIAGAVVYALWLLIQRTRKGLVRWRGAIRLAVPTTLLFALGPLLSIELMLKAYSTAMPLETYRAIMYTALLMTVIFAFLILGAAAALLTSFCPESMAALRAASRRLLGLDAGAALLVAIGLWVFLNQLDAVLADRFHAQALFAIGSPDLIVSHAPALAAVAEAARSLLMNAAILAFIAIVVRKLPKWWMLAPLALAALSVNLSGDIRTPGEFALQYGMALIWGGCAVLFCLCFARKNYLAYALVLWMLALRPAMMQLFGNANPALQMQGWMVAGVLALSVAWAVAPALGRRASA
ncbi:MAG: type II CAAX endopeptidase family protein [Bryobacteraceae bacterium]|jgi:membrane protease YdiL (CAAX protease family)